MTDEKEPEQAPTSTRGPKLDDETKRLVRGLEAFAYGAGITGDQFVAGIRAAFGHDEPARQVDVVSPYRAPAPPPLDPSDEESPDAVLLRALARESPAQAEVVSRIVEQRDRYRTVFEALASVAGVVFADREPNAVYDEVAGLIRKLRHGG